MLGVETCSKICYVCGIFSSYHCSKCKIINYCSRLHQIWDWKTNHKELCGKEKVVNYKTFLFPEFELVTEIEKSDKENELKKFEHLIEIGQAGSLQSEDLNDLLKMANNIEDKTFSKFCKGIQNEPEQVLRFDNSYFKYN
jgi:pre-rRNA-processing protein TSR4